MAPRCDNTAVGVIVTDQAGRMLTLLTRAQPPVGVAPVAGHVDGHGSPRLAAIAEVREEVGFDAVRLREVASGRRPNRCRRPGGSWHQWTIFRAEVTGTMRPSADETRGARWYHPGEVQTLADRTAAHSRGHIAGWDRDPGLEPVWVGWLAELGVVRMDRWWLDQVAKLASR